MLPLSPAWRLLAAALAASVFAAGCYVAPSEGPSLRADELCLAQQRLTLCELPQRCGAAAPDAPCDDILRQQGVPADLDCSGPLLAAIDAGLVRYDGVAAKQCLDGWRASAPCDRFPEPSVACDTMVVGLQPAGAPCLDSRTCSAGLYCDQGNACDGVCAPRGAAGGLVTRPDGCAVGLAALFEADGRWRCQAPVATGAECRRADQVQTRGNLCASPSDECRVAADGLVRCLAKWPPAQVQRHGACDPGAGRWCQLGLACAATDGGTEGTCEALLAVGQSCSADPRGCERDARCGGGSVCQALATSGEACGVDTDCTEGTFCAMGACQPRKRRGSPCATHSECQPSLLCQNFRCGDLACGR